MKILQSSIIVLSLAVPGLAQSLPQGSHVLLYFPQLADGGDFSSKWQTTFTFVNPNQTPANVTLETYGNEGYPMQMDFGSGPGVRSQFYIPSNGSRILQSRVISSITQVGWAIALSSMPLQATASYRQYVNAVPKQEMSAQPTLPCLAYRSPANKYLGVAIANPTSDTAINVKIQFIDSEGTAFQPVNVTVPANGHTAFILGEKMAWLGERFGSVQIVASQPPYDQFAAWTLGGDAQNVWSSLPPGSYSWPVSHWDRIWLVYLQVADNARRSGYFDSIPELRIRSEREINAHAVSGQRVEIYLALSQLISDSPSELAFVIGHELGHIYQQKNGGRLTFNLNPEFDADVWGVFLSLGAGYDPYACAGVLGKLSMASGQAGLITQFGLELSDVHRSFNSRLENIFNSITQTCNLNADLKSACDYYKSVIHPNLPSSAPLGRPPVVK